MPQLAPMYWLLLALTFWSLILTVTALLWWAQTPSIQIKMNSSQTRHTNLWKW